MHEFCQLLDINGCSVHGIVTLELKGLVDSQKDVKSKLVAKASCF